MALTIQLSPEIETEILAAAAREGIAPAEWAARALTERFAVAGRSPLVTVSDETLEGILQENLPVAFWRQYSDLRGHLRAETLSEAQREELLPLIDEMEIFNARRMTALAELARRRQVDPLALMAELHIAPLQIPA